MKLLDKLKDKRFRPIMAESWSVCWPMALIMFFEFLTGIADVYIAGKFGKEAQAAYGIAFQVYFAFIIIAMALNVGTVSVVARLFTSGRKEEFNDAVNTSLITAGVAGLLCAGAGVLLARSIIGIFNVPDAIKAVAAPLFMIYSLGLLFEYMLMNTNAVMRACDMIKKSLVTMTVICLLNIILNFVFAFHTPLGLRGIAVATVISLFLGSIINLVHTRKLITRMTRFSVSFLRNIIDIGWPSGLLSLLWQMGAMVLFYILSLLPVNSIETIAAFTNGLKIESMIFLPAFAFNMANAVVVGNLLGKGDKEDAFYGGLITAVMGVGIVIIITALTLLNARTIVSALSDNRTVIYECLRYIYIALLFEPLMAWGVILGGGLNGAGDTKRVMIIVGSCIWLIRIPLSYLLAVHFRLGPVAVWWSMNFSMLIQSILMSRRYFGRRWISRALESVPTSA